MFDLNSNIEKLKPNRKLYLAWLFILLSSVALAISGGIMIIGLYVQSLGFVALIALILSRSKNKSMRVRQYSYNFLIAFLLLAGIYLVVGIWHLIFIIGH